MREEKLSVIITGDRMILANCTKKILSPQSPLKGSVAMITMQSWMFLSSFEKLRNKILDYATISSMAHLGARAFDSIGGEVVSTTAFVLDNEHHPDYKGTFLRLVDGQSEDEKSRMMREAIAQA